MGARSDAVGHAMFVGDCRRRGSRTAVMVSFGILTLLTTGRTIFMADSWKLALLYARSSQLKAGTALYRLHLGIGDPARTALWSWNRRSVPLVA